MKQADVIQHGIVHRLTDSPFRYHGWPSVCRLDDGGIAAVWSGFRVEHVCPFGKTAMSVSRDEGETWSAPMIVNDTALDDRDAGIVNTGGGKLLLTWFCHPIKWMLETGLPRRIKELPKELSALCAAYIDYYDTLTEDEGRGGSFVRISRDNGVTWGKTVSVPVSSPHGPALLSDGSLLYLGKELFKDKGAIAACISNDSGETWEKISEVGVPEGMTLNLFHEPHCVELPDGSLLGAIRVHGDDYFSVYCTRSFDKGRSWSKAEPLVPEGTGKKVCGSPPHLLLHSSGKLICSIGRRKEPRGERALVSADGGQSWDERTLRDDSPSWDLGYPASVELKDGSVLTVYYQRFSSDTVTSILYTKWRL